MVGRHAYLEFIDDWRKQRLAGLGAIEFEHVLEARSRELTELTMRNGFRAALTDESKPYRTINGYVRALYERTTYGTG